MKHLKARLLTKQLKNDLIGKDSHRGVTLTYAWLANQTGHITLGFIPTLFLSKCPSVLNFVSPAYSITFPYVLSACLVCIFWVCFETLNFLIPILLDSSIFPSVRDIFQNKKGHFNPAWKHISFDTYTDILFFSFGAFFAAYVIDESATQKITAYITIGILLLLIYPIVYWYQIKMYQQGPKFPFQFRLGQWNKPIDDLLLQTVNNYLKTITTSTGNHLIISGKPNAGKSSLGVGIGTEYSIKMNKVIYLKSYDFFDFVFTDRLTHIAC